ncbi:MAG: hypothetical protein AAGH99_01245 [Planctomycetota bacterium]
MTPRSLMPTIKNTASATAVTLGTLTSAFTSPAAIAEPGPGWEALPAETVFAFRMPHTQTFLEELRANTVAGQRIFTAEKVDQILTLVQQENEADWQDMVDGLAEYGFTLDDLMAIAKNNWGMGVVAQERGADELPRMLLLGWADMEDADIDRIYAAIDKAWEENEINEYSRRLEYELAGLTISRFSNGVTGPDRVIDWDTPDDFNLMTPDQQNAHWEELQKMNDEVEWVKIDEGHLMLTRMPGRLLVAHAFPQSADNVRKLMEIDPDIDWDMATDVDTGERIFANFIESLDGGAEDSFAAKVLAQPDAAAAVASELSLFELYADGPALLDLIEVAIASEEGEEDARQFRTVMDALGFDGLGVIAGSGYLADGAFRADFFSQMDSPRSGLLGTLDGQTLPAAPPAWVPAGVSYGHLAYDLGKLYDVVVQAAQAVGGPEVMQQVQFGNMMVQGQIQADIPTILSSLGIRHSFIAAESREITIETEQYDVETETFKTVETTQMMQPFALVWELEDPVVFDRIMNTAKGFAAGAGEMVQFVDEQGFTGVRSDAAGMSMGVMLGQGKLVVGVGPEILTETLAAINNPPAGEASLVGSPLYREGEALLGAQENILYVIQDTGADWVSYKKQIVKLIEEQGDLDDALLEEIKALLPSDADLKAAFGVTVADAVMTESGLVYRGATALPAE